MQVSQVHEAVQQLVRWSEDLVFTEQNSQLVATQLISANNLLLVSVYLLVQLLFAFFIN